VNLLGIISESVSTIWEYFSYSCELVGRKKNYNIGEYLCGVLEIKKQREKREEERTHKQF
jgi:SRSO17 transposase